MIPLRRAIARAVRSVYNIVVEIKTSKLLF